MRAAGATPPSAAAGAPAGDAAPAGAAAGVASASSMVAMVGSGSYSTRTRAAASAAASSETAATAATGSPTKRTLSGQRACSSWDTGRMPNGTGKSAPVRKPSTPGTRAAALVSTARIEACGTVERTRRRKAMRGKVRSSAKRVAPVTLARPSTRRKGLPMRFGSRPGASSGARPGVRSGAASGARSGVASGARPGRRSGARSGSAAGGAGEAGLRTGAAMAAREAVRGRRGSRRGREGKRGRGGVRRRRAVEHLPGRRPLFAAQAGGGPFHGLYDLVVAGAAAEVAGERGPDLVRARARVAGEQGLGGHQQARSAVAALGRAEVGESGLERVEVVAELEPLDGLDRASLGLRRQHQAGEHRPPVEEHRAGPTLAELAAVLGAGQGALLAQHLEQGVVAGRNHRALLAVDGEGEGPEAISHRRPSVGSGVDGAGAASASAGSPLAPASSAPAASARGGAVKAAPGASRPRTSSSADSRPISPASLPPPGRNHLTVQLMAPRMASAATLASSGRNCPAAIPSSISSRKTRS